MDRLNLRLMPTYARRAVLRRILHCALAGTLLAGAAPAAGQGEVITLSGQTMGTTYSIRIVAPANTVDRTVLQADVDAVLDEVNQQMSTWREDSEISRFNHHTTDDWFAVSPEFVRVIQRALEVAEDSGGAFDPTVSPLVGLWNFGSDAARNGIPGDEEINTALSHIGYNLIDVRSDPPAVRKLDPQVRLDLSAIAKGHGVDRVAEVLSDAGLTAWMVEIGGEVRTRGTKPDGSPWRIGIEQPVAGQRLLHSTLDLSDTALATSGDYRSFFEHNGVLYSHTIDPSTGRPVEHYLASVTVLADDCMTADAWATTLMVLGPDAGPAWANERGIRAYFILRDGDGFAAIRTTGFPASDVPAAAADAAHWTTFLLALVVFGAAVIGLAIGIILSNRRLRGTCGGLAGMQDEGGRPICDACTNPAEECNEFRRQAAAAKSSEADSTSG